MKTIDSNQLQQITGGVQINVGIDELLRAMDGGAKTKEATRAIHALGKLGVR